MLSSMQWQLAENNINQYNSRQPILKYVILFNVISKYVILLNAILKYVILFCVNLKYVMP
jgi:hypothetical protein